MPVDEAEATPQASARRAHSPISAIKDDPQLDVPQNFRAR
jgi:hypothetical protein